MAEVSAKTVSPAQMAANRRNAQKSTGPRTAHGRDVSKMNALKHGFLSEATVIRGKHARESERQFRNLRKSFWEHLVPVGPLEEMLVDQIVTANWRLRRALKVEAGEIALNVDDGQWKRSRRNMMLESLGWEVFGDPSHGMRNSSIGNSLMRRQLAAVRACVEKENELTEAAILQNVSFHGKPYELTVDLQNLRTQLQSNPEGLAADALRDRQKAAALKFIDRELNSISWNLDVCVEHEENEEEARQASAMLPPPEVLEKLMRYETKLERQLYRAMNQLERLQRLRKGEQVPPPLTMDVGERS